MPDPTAQEQGARCSQCREVKPLEDFYRDASRGNGRSHRCKLCDHRRPREKRGRPRLQHNRRMQARYRQRYPEKNRAKAAVNRAVKQGQLVRPTQCEDCGWESEPAKDGRAAIHAHHDDYSKPLDVAWLCIRCHRGRHDG